MVLLVFLINCLFMLKISSIPFRLSPKLYYYSILPYFPDAAHQYGLNSTVYYAAADKSCRGLLCHNFGGASDKKAVYFPALWAKILNPKQKGLTHSHVYPFLTIFSNF